MAAQDTLPFQPLSLLYENFKANCRALHGRMPGLAQSLFHHCPQHDYELRAHAGGVEVRRTPNGGGESQPVAVRVAPATAQQIIQRVCPKGELTQGLAVAGLDQGWLWDGLWRRKCAARALPGHRIPLHFMVRDIEELWLALHVHDWRAMLADPRVQLFVGPDCLQEFERSLLERPRIPWPRMALTVDQGMWNGGSLDAILQRCFAALNQRAGMVVKRLANAYAWATPAALAERYAAGQPLRVIGLTSQYTTFLQYSMRDWLEGFAQLGHRTRLVIESADHELNSATVLAEHCLEFQPDLVLLIDHYRQEFRPFPQEAPCVMWVQDFLPHIYDSRAGAAQGSRDYVVGHGKLECVAQYGYPESRFMPATLAINERRFAPRVVTAHQREKFACDVSYVSHAGRPAEQLVEERVQRTSDERLQRVLRDGYARMAAVYASGKALTQPAAIAAVIEPAARAEGASLGEVSSLVDFFTHHVNNALFRHQGLEWAAELGVDLRIYGRGWEQHPRLKAYAKGVADNEEHLAAIYQLSRINLQIFPHGAMHQRLMEGLSAGGFFLLRGCPNDPAERLYRPLWEFCREQGIKTDEELVARARTTRAVQAILDQLGAMFDWDPMQFGRPLVDILRLADDCQYMRSAAVAFGDDYERVAFNSREELHARIEYYLSHEQERSELAARMRGVVLEHYTYSRISQRLLEFITADLLRQAQEARALPPQRLAAG